MAELSISPESMGAITGDFFSDIRPDAGAVFLMQWKSGIIVEQFADAADPAYVYRIVLGFLGVKTLPALLVYLRIEEARPGVADSG